MNTRLVISAVIAALTGVLVATLAERTGEETNPFLQLESVRNLPDTAPKEANPFLKLESVKDLPEKEQSALHRNKQQEPSSNPEEQQASGNPFDEFDYHKESNPFAELESFKQTQHQKEPVEPGNIDLNNRPPVKNPDGTISTIRSISVNFDGKEVLIPTISDDGREFSEEQAIQQYLKTGKHLGKFSSVDEATRYAKELSARQGQQQERSTTPSLGLKGLRTFRTKAAAPAQTRS